MLTRASKSPRGGSDHDHGSETWTKKVSFVHPFPVLRGLYLPVDEVQLAKYSTRGGTITSRALQFTSTSADLPPHAVAGPRYGEISGSNNVCFLKFPLQLSLQYHPSCHQGKAK
jgi:hypothetical protein